jgi:hypothetical protein
LCGNGRSTEPILNKLEEVKRMTYSLMKKLSPSHSPLPTNAMDTKQVDDALGKGRRLKAIRFGEPVAKVTVVTGAKPE